MNNPNLAEYQMSIAHESSVRELRNQVFGQISTDRNWEGCKAHWLQPEETAWLNSRVNPSQRIN